MDGQGKRHRQISERFWYRINADQPLKQNPAVIGDDCFWGRTVAKKVKKMLFGPAASDYGTNFCGTERRKINDRSYGYRKTVETRNFRA